MIIDEIDLLLKQSSDPPAKGLIFSGKLEMVIGFTQTRNQETANFR